MTKLLLVTVLIATLLLGADIMLRVVSAMETADEATECPAPDTEDDWPDEWLAPIQASVTLQKDPQ